VLAILAALAAVYFIGNCDDSSLGAAAFAVPAGIVETVPETPYEYGFYTIDAGASGAEQEL
jgi:hypothetical protein